MSNSVTVINPKFYGEARDVVRAVRGALVATRAGKKATVTRGALGIALSGNKDEKTQLANHLAVELWASGNFAAIAAEITRVFPKIADAIKARNDAVALAAAEDPECKLRPIDLERVGKIDCAGMFAVAGRMAGADKGEKAKLIACGVAINAFEAEVRTLAIELQEKAAREAQSEAATA